MQHTHEQPLSRAQSILYMGDMNEEIKNEKNIINYSGKMVF